MPKPTNRGRRKIGVADYQAKGALFLPQEARFNTLLNLPESTDIGKKLVKAMKGLKKSSAKMFPADSVMMTSRATIGVKSINTQTTSTNQGFITCIPNDKLSAYQIYFWIEENLEKINNFTSGATFKEISKTNLRQLPIIIVGDEVRKKIVKYITPIGEKIKNLQQKKQPPANPRPPPPPINIRINRRRKPQHQN
ncbi:MAG: restriction endonuclease subunit S [Microcoleaceae cyanobacterium]